MARVWFAALGAVIILAGGCSSDEGAGSSSEGGGSEAPATPAETTTEAVTVSTQSTCDLLFSQGDPALWQQAVDLAQKSGDLTPTDANNAFMVSEDLAEVAESADAELKPHVSVMAEEMRDFYELLQSGGGTPQWSDFKAAGTEVGNICAPYVADQSSAG